MIYNVTLCRQLIFEDAISADSEEEAVEIAMERNGDDELNWRRNGPTQVVCVEPAYDGVDSSGTSMLDMDDSQGWEDDEEDVEWALD